jgi:hypothetical protein
MNRSSNSAHPRARNRRRRLRTHQIHSRGSKFSNRHRRHRLCISSRDWRFRDSNRRFSNSDCRLSISDGNWEFRERHERGGDCDGDGFRGKCFRGRYCETVASSCYGRCRESGDDS